MLLNDVVMQNNGYLSVKNALECGFSRRNIETFIKQFNFEKVSKGIYISPAIWPDDLYVLSIRNNGIVYSHETALYLHGLMEREPSQIACTVRFGYNATHLRKKGVKVYSAIDDYFEIGIDEIQTSFGNLVKCYDLERTICDIIRNKKNMDIQVFNYALKEYVKKNNKNLYKLSNYARKFGIKDKVDVYMEILL